MPARPKQPPEHSARASTWDSRAIGVLDSGVGGLSVLREISRQLPHENVIYVADTVHCPYGPRPPQEIQQLAEGVVSFLLRQQAKIAVVACNTISAAALSVLRSRFPLPIVGMVPAVKPAAAATATGVVGVIATETTIQGTLFAELVDRYASGVRVITQVCPGLVEAVEAGELDSPATEALLRRYLKPMLAQGMDSLVLGCTHYPFLIRAMQRIVGDGVTIIDPSPAIARQTGRVLEANDLRGDPSQAGRRVYVTTGDPAVFAARLRALVGEEGSVQQASWVEKGGTPQLRTRAEAG